MSNWKLTSELEYEAITSFVYDKLFFAPNGAKDEIIELPCPNKIFDIHKYYDSGFEEELYNDLHTSAIKWFKNIANEGIIYAYNWQHDCYSFSPYLPMETDEFNEWLIPVFPNGDYLFFVSGNFNNGIFADGINLTISIWGKEIVKAVEIDTPLMFK